MQNYFSTDDNLSECAECIASFAMNSGPSPTSVPNIDFIRKRVLRG
jgi:hypothetical protein